MGNATTTVHIYREGAVSSCSQSVSKENVFNLKRGEQGEEEHDI